MKCIVVQVHKHEYSWAVKKKETPQRQYLGHNTPFDHDTDRSHPGLGQYDGLGEYCDPHTASSVFLIHMHIKGEV